jgi:ribosomal 50S subunit-associated protein YjgA (DUF615 family)
MYSFRIPGPELERARRVARAHGLSLTELIRLRLRDLPVPDRTEQQRRFEAIHALTREMQYIGHNINQVTVAIHRANRRGQSFGAALERFEGLLQAYLDTRERLRILLEQYQQP